MKLHWLQLGLFLAVSANAQSPAYLLPGQWIPFFHRVDPQEFRVIEEKMGQHDSESSLLVIYHGVVGDIPLEKLAIRRDPEHGYVLSYEECRLFPSSVIRKKVVLPNSAAEKLLEVMKFVMTHRIFAPTSRVADNFSTNPTGGISNLWVALGKAGEDAAGFAQFDRCGKDMDSNFLFYEYVDRLKRCALNDQSEKSPLVQLELAGIRLIDSYPKAP